MIQFLNVNKGYDRKIVLEDINWNVEKGHCVGLVGPNGSGKSTLLRMISGVMEPDAGIIEIDGQDIFENPDKKGKIFFLGDEPFFFNQSTIHEMMQFYKLFYPNFDSVMYQNLLKEFKLNPRTKINSFSKGMKRQVVLILALACKPEILLLDEAFDGLDPMMRFKLRQYISNEISERNILVIISSHNLRELEDICDNIVMINNRTLQFSHTTYDVQNIYHKYQIVFQDDTDIETLKALKPLHVSGKSRIFTIVFKGERETIQNQLETLNPMILESNAISLEEVFIYEMEDSSNEELA